MSGEAFWQVDLAGSRVQLDQDNMDELMHALNFEPESRWTLLEDLYGSPVRVFHGRIEAISYITPASVAAYRKQQRAFADAVDGLDPEGACAKAAPWESE